MSKKGWVLWLLAISGIFIGGVYAKGHVEKRWADEILEARSGSTSNTIDLAILDEGLEDGKLSMWEIQEAICSKDAFCSVTGSFIAYLVPTNAEMIVQMVRTQLRMNQMEGENITDQGA